MICPICEREEETVEHILWSYPLVNDVWGCGGIKFQKRSGEGKNFIQVFKEMSVYCERTDLVLFAVTARYIRLRRNILIH